MKKEYRTIFLIMGVLIIFLGLTFSAIAEEFSADLKIKQPDKEYELKYYVKGSLYRLEKLTGEDRILLIADRKLDMTWMLNPEDKIYIELKGTDAAFFNPSPDKCYRQRKLARSLYGNFRSPSGKRR